VYDTNPAGSTGLTSDPMLAQKVSKSTTHPRGLTANHRFTLPTSSLGTSAANVVPVSQPDSA
jgi:hypothetical protein